MNSSLWEQALVQDAHGKFCEAFRSGIPRGHGDQVFEEGDESFGVRFGKIRCMMSNSGLFHCTWASVSKSRARHPVDSPELTNSDAASDNLSYQSRDDEPVARINLLGSQATGIESQSHCNNSQRREHGYENLQPVTCILGRRVHLACHDLVQIRETTGRDGDGMADELG